MLPRRLKHGLAASAAIWSCSAYATGFLQLYSEARESDPRYVAAKADVDFAQSLVVQSRGQLLPQIGITGSQIKNDTDNEQRTILGTVNREYSFTSKNASLNLSQALFRPQAWVGYGQSKAQVLVSEEQLRQARQDLILRLAQAYFDVLLQAGWIGLIFFVALAGVALVRSWIDASERRSIVYAWTPLVLVALLVDSMFESFTLAGMGWMLLVVCAVRAGQSRSWRERAFWCFWQYL